MASNEKIRDLFKKDLAVINMGLASFAENLKEVDAQVLQMDWRPPAGGNAQLAALLKKLGR